VLISLRVLNILHSTYPLSAAILFFLSTSSTNTRIKRLLILFWEAVVTVSLSYQGISLLHLHSGYRNNSMEYCSGNSIVGTLFHSTGRLLGVYFQFLDQSRHRRMPSPLFVKKRNNSTKYLLGDNQLQEVTPKQKLYEKETGTFPKTQFLPINCPI